MSPDNSVDAASGRTAFSWTAATIAYYEQTLFDYRTVWLIRSNLAFHFGFHDDEHRSHAAALENTNRTLARIGGIGTDDRVLDAGCGLGGSSLWLAQHLGTRVVGITLAQSQVDLASRIAARRRWRIRSGSSARTSPPHHFPTARSMSSGPSRAFAMPR